MQNRRKFLIQGSLAAGAAALLKPLEGFSKVLSYTGVKSHETLTILHTSDLHIAATPTIGVSTAETISANLLSISNKVKEIRDTNPNIVLLHNGNIFGASHTTEEAQTQYLRLMQQTGYDAVVEGKEDRYDKLPVAITNKVMPILVDSLDNAALFNLSQKLPYRVVRKGNIKAGVITNAVKNNFSIEEKATALSNTAQYLKEKQGCHIVICLSTGNIGGDSDSPVQNDIEMASLSNFVDVIISGNNTVSRPINRIYRNANKAEVFVHATTHAGSAVGRIDIEFDENFLKRNIRAYYK